MNIWRFNLQIFYLHTHQHTILVVTVEDIVVQIVVTILVNRMLLIYQQTILQIVIIQEHARIIVLWVRVVPDALKKVLADAEVIMRVL